MFAMVRSTQIFQLNELKDGKHSNRREEHGISRRRNMSSRSCRGRVQECAVACGTEQGMNDTDLKDLRESGLCGL